MKKNGKKLESANEVTNNVPTNVEEFYEAEAPTEAPTEVDELKAKAAEAKAAYEAARQAVKEAKERAKLTNGRPYRNHVFEARFDALDPQTVFKRMETFYYVEKAIVDYLTEGRNLGEYRKAYLVQATKEEFNELKKELLIATYRVDEISGQIIIEA